MYTKWNISIIKTLILQLLLIVSMDAVSQDLCEFAKEYHERSTLSDTYLDGQVITESWMEVDQIFGDTTTYYKTSSYPVSYGTEPLIIEKFWGMYNCRQVVAFSDDLEWLRENYFDPLSNEIWNCLKDDEGWEFETIDDMENDFKIEYLATKPELYGLTADVLSVVIRESYSDEGKYKITVIF